MKKWDSHFQLGDTVTAEQLDFFDKHGVIVFRNFISREKVNIFIDELKRLEQTWLEEGRDKVNGIPLKFGKDEHGNKTIQRLCFSSLYSDPLHQLLEDDRLKALTAFLGPYEGRIAENEKDGLVINNYINTPNSSFTQMGWHTDAPRDLFLGQKIMPMLNVGIHLDTCPFENGGLRVIPGTHKQGVLKLLFAAILDVWKPARPAGALLVLVPRPPQRFDEVAALAGARGFRVARRSEGGAPPEDAEVWIGDSLGEMFAYYAAAKDNGVAFVGDSLLPYGSQNLIEACAVGVPVLIGPSTYNFAQAAADALVAGAARQVPDAEELVWTAAELLGDGESGRKMGEAGRAFAERHRGATARAMALVERFIPEAR